MRALALLSLLLPFAAHAEGPASAPTDPGVARPDAPDFTLTTLDGEKVHLADLKGRVVLISFWASWCGPCKQELPHLDALATELGARGLTVLAIATDGPKTQADVRRLVKLKAWKLPIPLDPDGAVGALLNPRQAMPATVLLDRRLRRAFEHEGYQSGDEATLRARVEALLAEPAQ